MRRFILAVPLLMCACQAGWPTGSYSAVDPEEARTLAPAIAEFASSTLKGSEGPIAVDPSSQGDAIAQFLPDTLLRYGIRIGSGGEPLQYIATPVDGGVLLRVSIGGSIGSRLYTVSGGSLAPAGPMMVATQ